MISTTLSDGTSLVSYSKRRYITFAVADDSKVYVLKRTDNRSTADANHRKARVGSCRVVTVDFGVVPARIVRDS